MVAWNRPRSPRLARITRAGSVLAPALLLATLAFVPVTADGQTAITSSGLGTRITRSGATFSIEGGTQRGSNLFHSFGSFSVGANDTARFNNATGATIGNIIGRVSGGLPSSISGTIDTLSYPGAHLFLINPAGIVVGRGARLSVGGSVHLSTADSVRFSSGPAFHAVPDPGRDRVLSVSSPVAFGFLQSTPASITVRDSQLQVSPGRTLSLVGGDVNVVDSTLTASGGRVQIASVASPPADVAVSDGLDVSPGASLGRISLRNARLDVSGSPAGSVVIRGGQLVASASTVSATSLSSLPAPIAVDISVTGTVRLAETTRLDTAAFGAGRSGDIRVSADRIVIEDSRISTTAFNMGAGGDVRLSAEDAVTISGAAVVDTTTAAIRESGVGGRLVVEAPTVTLADGVQLVSRTFRAAAGGDIVVEATTLSLSGGSVLFSRTSGAPGGDVIVRAAGDVTMSGGGIRTGGNLGGSGNAVIGDITLDVGSLTLTDAAGIDSGETAGRTGNLTITARDAIVVTGGSHITSQAFAQQIGRIRLSADSVLIDHGFILASTSGGSRAGDIAMSVGSLRLLNGGQIVTSSELGATAPGGNLDVVARGSVLIAGSSPDGEPVTPLVSTPHSGLFSTAAGSGSGGRIAIRASDVHLADDGRISVETTGRGTAGSIDLESRTLTMASRSRVDSGTSGAGAGGTIAVRVEGPLVMTGRAGLFSDTRSTGAGGNIGIAAEDISLVDGATISATSTGTGDAGNVNVVFGDRLRLSNSTITTASADAPGGNISITSTGSLFYLLDSQITTSVHGGVGGGGNIAIGADGHPLDFVVLNNGGIHADAHGGPGGNIDILAHAFFTNVPIERAVTASSALSAPGTINISAPITDVSGSLAELPAGLFEAAALLRASCAARLAEGKASSLVVAGREGVPFEPGGLLPSGLDEGRSAPTTSRQMDGISSGLPPLRLSYVARDCGGTR